MKTKLMITLALLFCFVLSESLTAGPTNPLFTAFGPPIQGLEFRTGKDKGADWEVGIGFTQTYNQQNASVWDNTWWTINKTYNFTYGINSSGVGTFSMYVNPSQTINLTWSGMTLGNALHIHAKRDVDVTFAGLSLSGNPADAFGVDHGYIIIDPLAGFSYTGTITFRALGSGGSTQGVTIKSGNMIPEPGTILLLGSGFLGLGLIGWYRRRKA